MYQFTSLQTPATAPDLHFPPPQPTHSAPSAAPLPPVADGRCFIEKEACIEKGATKKGKADGLPGPADTSTFSVEERLVAAVWVHERPRIRLSMGQIKRDFRKRFDKAPPTKNTLLMWEKKLFATGNIMDARRSGRPCRRKEHIQAVEASVQQSPGMSLRARAASLAVPRTTLHKILHEDLRVDRALRGRATGEGNALPVKKKREDKPPKKKTTKRKATVNHQPPEHRPPAVNHHPQPEPIHHNPPSNPINYHGYGEIMVPIDFHSYMGYQHHDKSHLHQTPSIEHHYVINGVQGNGMFKTYDLDQG